MGAGAGSGARARQLVLAVRPAARFRRPEAFTLGTVGRSRRVAEGDALPAVGRAASPGARPGQPAAGALRMQLGARLEGCSARTEGVAQVVARSPRTTKPKAAEAELLATPAESPRKPAPKGGKVAAAIDKLLDSLFLDEAGEAKAAIARALA